MQEESEEEDEDEEDDNEEMDLDEEEPNQIGFQSTMSGLETPNLPLLTSGADTPDVIQLRKDKS